MTCPNSTESGCRCVEHHPGLGLTPQEPAVLRLIPSGPPAPSSDQIVERLLAAARADCTACGGDPARCRAGTGTPKFDRLAGCNAYDDAGDLTPLKAKTAPRQPWMPRPARKTAA